MHTFDRWPRYTTLRYNQEIICFDAALITLQMIHISKCHYSYIRVERTNHRQWPSARPIFHEDKYKSGPSGSLSPLSGGNLSYLHAALRQIIKRLPVHVGRPGDRQLWIWISNTQPHTFNSSCDRCHWISATQKTVSILIPVKHC